MEKAVTGVNFIEPKPRATWMPSDPIWILRLLGGNWRLMALSGLVCMFALLAVLVVLSGAFTAILLMSD